MFLIGVYALLLLPNPGPIALIALLALLGSYYAATNGVLMALASTIVPDGLRTTRLALLTTFVAIAQFFASVLFGALWGWVGPADAVLGFTVGLAGALAIAAVLLVTNREIGPRLVD